MKSGHIAVAKVGADVVDQLIRQTRKTRRVFALLAHGVDGCYAFNVKQNDKERRSCSTVEKVEGEEDEEEREGE